MKVLTAGVKGQGKNKWTPKRRKNNKQQEEQNNIQTQVDEEEAAAGGKQQSAEGDSTPRATGSLMQGNDNDIMNGNLMNNDTTPPPSNDTTTNDDEPAIMDRRRLLKIQRASVKLDDLYSAPPVIQDDEEEALDEETAKSRRSSEYFWLAFCFFGIMGSFVCYGLLLEFATSGGKHLHELSFLFVTSLLYTLTASVGRYARAEKPSTIPPAQFAVLGLTSMGSTFFSVRALRYVIYPIQVLAKSCKPVPVMLMGALMGKKYPMKKYMKVALIVAGVGLFMGGGANNKSSDSDEEKDASSQLIGVSLLFVSLCFDGGTGAYEDKLMSVHSVGPFDLMYNIQMGKTILAGIGLIVLNQVHVFAQMCQDMGFLLVALGLSGAIGQVFIFVTISKFGALTCSIIGLARKVTTLVASIYFYGHSLNKVQAAGLLLAVGAMVNDFFGKKGGNNHGHGGGGGGGGESSDDSQHQKGVQFKDGNLEEHQPMLSTVSEASSLEMGQLDKK
mmetsp:Transcript_15075/g.32711  ORF Transcript_15075/g.32711 Transcript_15075/m.32711 type:complete len:501 (+) Transcript_15075:221-1723(+)|eukprot:CAMPEP_0172319214 /NCGR_PEP_ID=MMETSP1058-20130122/37090_1 /TAXON_ID=83371 /ORGANISM="Detonula confervacea, Strain CCMP 353" /LENGTH=500 /DNA_ID=CAMNT_0013034213 /DNA_START=180 /DNA_END=1682 /DNA_ORIENTATION=-